MPARTIDEVISKLDAIIERSRRDNDRSGYFACLYRNVTINVKRGIATGRFQDGARMEKLDVLFANRYLDAYDAWRAGKPTTRSWKAAFTAAGSWPPLIVQHLMLGINAHINLDLGIAAVQTCNGDPLLALKHDFDAINNLLGEMLDDVQMRIAKVSPWMGILDSVGCRTDEQICGFCLNQARDISWLSANTLHPLSAPQLATEIDRADCRVAALAEPIRNPGLYLSSALLLARVRESNDVRRVIDALY